MIHPPIAQVIFGLPVEGPFDYLIPDELLSRVSPGQRVLVRFAGKKRVGFVLRLLDTSAHAGKFSVIIKALDEAPVFCATDLCLADAFASRFACTTGEALDAFLPAYLREPKLFKMEERKAPVLKIPEPRHTLIFDRGQTRRWDVLLPEIAATLHAGRGVLVLIPEASRCADILPKLGPLAAADERVLMTRGTAKEEYARWRMIRSGQARLVAGFISAVFAPVQDLGLIVILEEESSFYRHDQSPFYHAREVAFDRAALERARVVCVSSAPSVEIWHRALEGQVERIVLDEAQTPVKFLDLTNFKMKKGTFVAPGAWRHVDAALKQGHKVLMYIQAARGVAGVVEEVKRSFPAAKVAGYDKASRDLPDADVLVATQVVFRHHAHLRVAVTLVLDMDWEFHKHDHQAAHGAFALTQHLRQMTQQAVFLQTRRADDPLLRLLASADAKDFYDQELSLRRQMHLPPFAAIATLVVRAADPELACAEAKRLYDMLASTDRRDVIVLDPQQDRTPVARGKFRYCISVQGPVRQDVVGVIKGVLRTFRAKKDTVITVSVS